MLSSYLDLQLIHQHYWGSHQKSLFHPLISNGQILFFLIEDPSTVALCLETMKVISFGLALLTKFLLLCLYVLLDETSFPVFLFPRYVLHLRFHQRRRIYGISQVGCRLLRCDGSSQFPKLVQHYSIMFTLFLFKQFLFYDNYKIY